MIPSAGYAQYNRDGSATSISDAIIEYHVYNRMPTSVNGTALRYNSHGLRTRKGGRSYRGYGKEIVEADDGGEVCFIISPNGLIYTRAGKQHTPITRNRQESVCSSGNSILYYSPFGEFASFGNLPRRLYTGYEYDSEWNMYNARKRLYAHNLRAFISVDPKLQYSSPYLYCMSDPFNNVDPTGEMGTGEIVNVAITAVTIVAAIIISVVTFGVAAPEASAAAAEVSFAEAGTGIASVAEAEATQILPQEAFDALEAAKAAGKAAAQAVKHIGRIAAEATAGAGIVAAGVGGVIADASAGEHINAYRAINDILIQPAIAMAGMFAGEGLISLFGKAEKLFEKTAFRFASVSISAALSGFAMNVASSAAEKQDLKKNKTWENIGINTAVITALAMLTFGIGSRIKSRIKAKRLANQAMELSDVAADAPRLGDGPIPEGVDAFFDPDEFGFTETNPLDMAPVGDGYDPYADLYEVG